MLSNQRSYTSFVFSTSLMDSIVSVTEFGASIDEEATVEVIEIWHSTVKPIIQGIK